MMSSIESETSDQKSINVGSSSEMASTSNDATRTRNHSNSSFDELAALFNHNGGVELNELKAKLLELNLVESNDELEALIAQIETTDDGFVCADALQQIMDRRSQSPSTTIEEFTITSETTPREFIMTYLQQLVQDEAVPSQQYDSFLRKLDDVFDSCTTKQEDADLTYRARYEQAEKDNRELKLSTQYLTEEYHRMEQELAQTTQLKRVIDDRTTEVENMRTEIKDKNAELETLKESTALASQAQTETERLNKVLKEQESQMDQHVKGVGKLEAERDAVAALYEEEKKEKGMLFRDLAALKDRLTTEGLIVKGQSDHASQLVEENVAANERVEEFQEIVGMKDEVIATLRQTLDDQNVLIQSMRLNGNSNHSMKGSLMNELADYVTKETQNEAQPQQDQHKLDQPQDQSEKGSTVEQGADNTEEVAWGEFNSTIAPFSADNAFPSEGDGGATLSNNNVDVDMDTTPSTEDQEGNEKSEQDEDNTEATPGELPEDHFEDTITVVVDKEGKGALGITFELSRDRETRLTTVIVASIIADGAVACSGEIEVGDEIICIEDNVLAVLTQAEFQVVLRNAGEHVVFLIRHPSKEQLHDRSIAMLQQQRPVTPQDSLESRMNLYAFALKQHAAGLKIVTRESASIMSATKLQRMVAILQDLVEARSGRLLNGLEERERLQTDIDVKRRAAQYMINATCEAVSISPAKKAVPVAPRPESAKSPRSGPTTPMQSNHGSSISVGSSPPPPQTSIAPTATTPASTQLSTQSSTQSPTTSTPQIVKPKSWWGASSSH